MDHELDPAIREHYEIGVERDRLTIWGRLEAERTRELLGRFLPAPPAVVLDVGGAEGAYALPLAATGYAVHLVDPVERHVDAARAASDGGGSAGVIGGCGREGRTGAAPRPHPLIMAT